MILLIFSFLVIFSVGQFFTPKYSPHVSKGKIGNLLPTSHVYPSPPTNSITSVSDPLSLQGSSECKGFAFVEFFSVEYAQHFTQTFAGSVQGGDANAPQLIVESRAVTLDFATPRDPDRDGDRGRDHHVSSGDNKSDWLCDTVRTRSNLRDRLQ